MVYRNLIQRHNRRGRRDLWVRYTSHQMFQDPSSPDDVYVSHPVFPEEHLNTVGWEGNIERELILAPLTFKLDLFYAVINAIAQEVARGQDVQRAIRRQIAFDIYDIEPPPFIPGNDGIFHRQLLRQLVETYNVAPGDRVTEGVTVHDFLNLCAGSPPYDFNLPPYPGE